MATALPPKLLIGSVRYAWTTLWRAMMARLAPSDRSGAYVRPASAFRAQSIPAAISGRYALIVGMGCPWAHRTLVVRALKGLEAAIPAIVVAPNPDEGGWVFEREHEGCRTLAQLYRLAQPAYSGRSTVPVLWDSKERTIINNESSEIIIILDAAFNQLALRPNLDLYPAPLRPTIDRWNEKIYHAVNNGVYRCGFAQSQTAYDQAAHELFATLDLLEAELATQRYLCGPTPTLADVRLFTTLFRFDAVYHGLFKCNRRRIRDYANLWGYLRDLYQLPGVAATCDVQAVMRDYYGSLFPLNPGGIIPIGPDPQDLLLPHGRG